MIGAILGDMIGAPYEFDKGKKTKVFPLWSKGSKFTDDTVMTVAVADALLCAHGYTEAETVACIAGRMRAWGASYPNAGYGGRFRVWLAKPGMGPYNSYVNGAAMRCAAAGWLARSLAEAERLGRLTAEPTHNHPEGIKAAEATAGAIWLARTGTDREGVVEYMTNCWSYALRPLAELRAANRHDETCQKTMPLVIAAIAESTGFEDAIRNAVSCSGDADTIACITGSIAEALYGVPEDIVEEGLSRLPYDIKLQLLRFECELEKRA